MAKQKVPGGLTIEEGKTDYTIELGKAFKVDIQASVRPRLARLPWMNFKWSSTCAT